MKQLSILNEMQKSKINYLFHSNSKTVYRYLEWVEKIVYSTREIVMVWCSKGITYY